MSFGFIDVNSFIDDIHIAIICFIYFIDVNGCINVIDFIDCIEFIHHIGFIDGVDFIYVAFIDELIVLT